MSQTYGLYQLKEKLGAGAFAEVYRAYDPRLGRDVALKLLKPFWMDDDQAVGRFKQEAKALAKLHHPHIVPIYDVGQANGRVYLAQHLVEGQSLAQRLERGPLPWPEALRIARCVAKALDFAHQQGLVHRDVKPSNILLGHDGQVYLSDFGLVRAAEESVTITTATGGMVGTPAYMAPEQWEMDQAASPATDVYALSCVVVEMLTGRRLFDGPTPAKVMKQHLVTGPQLPARWPSGVPAGITVVLRQGLAEEPGQRISSAGEFVARLVGEAPSTTDSTVYRSMARRSRRETKPRPVSRPQPAPPSRLEGERSQPVKQSHQSKRVTSSGNYRQKSRQLDDSDYDHIITAAMMVFYVGGPILFLTGMYNESGFLATVGVFLSFVPMGLGIIGFLFGTVRTVLKILGIVKRWLS